MKNTSKILMVVATMLAAYSSIAIASESGTSQIQTWYTLYEDGKPFHTTRVPSMEDCQEMLDKFGPEHRQSAKDNGTEAPDLRCSQSETSPVTGR